MGNVQNTPSRDRGHDLYRGNTLYDVVGCLSTDAQRAHPDGRISAIDIVSAVRQENLDG